MVKQLLIFCVERDASVAYCIHGNGMFSCVLFQLKLLFFFSKFCFEKVDRHPEFKSRCLFVVRTNGDFEDFSYHKCLRAYLQEKYPSYADKFLKKHLVEKRSNLFRVQKKAMMDPLPAGQLPGS